MNITTDKTSSGTIQGWKAAKKINETETITQNSGNIAEKLHKDFASVGMSVSYVKNKIISNNNRLLAYEEKVSENQFVKEKLNDLRGILSGYPEEEAWKFIAKTTFHGTPVLTQFFDRNAPLVAQLDYAEMMTMKRKVELDREFRALQVASQNLSSISPEPAMIESRKTAEEVHSQLQKDMVSYSLKSADLSGKRVMDLIS